jgi:hypothetical protein
LPSRPRCGPRFEEAYSVFRSLGTVIEDVRIRPAAGYYAVKIAIAESEQYAIHEEELRSRPGDFGVDFLVKDQHFSNSPTKGDRSR